MSRKNYGFGTVYKRPGNDVWYFHYSENGKTVRRSSGSTKRGEAEKQLKQRLAEVQRNEFTSAIDQVMVTELLDSLLRSYRVNKQKSTWWAEILVETHLRPFFKYHRAAKVGSDVIDRYVDFRQKVGRSNATINNELALLRRAFRLGFEAEPPRLSRVPKIKKLAVQNARSGFFEKADLLKICEHLPEEIAAIAKFAYHTGCRKTEILSLRWRQVNFKERIIRLEDTKNGEPRPIPIMKSIEPVLASLKTQREEFWPTCEFVFSRHGKRIRDFYATWRAACIAAGFVDSEGKATRLLHDMRRTGVRNLINAGVSEKIAMQISGHRTASVFKRYQIVAENDLHEAAKKLDEYDA